MEEPLKSPILKTNGPSIIPAILVLFGGVLLLAWDMFSGALIPAKGIALILAGMGYLLIRKRIPSNLKIATSPGLPGKPSIPLILNILFLITFSYTLIAVVTSEYILKRGMFCINRFSFSEVLSMACTSAYFC